MRRDFCPPPSPPEDAVRAVESVRRDLAELCENAYRASFEAMPGGPRYNATRWRDDWLKTADFLLANGLSADAAGFIRVQFAHWPNPSTSPRPPQCRGDAALRRYRATADDPHQRADELRLLLEHEKRLLRDAMDELRFSGGDSWSETDLVAHVALTDPSISALVKYTAAHRVGDGRLAAQLLSRALAQYLGDRRAYDEAWGDQLPAELVAAAGAS